jgi:cellulose synthase/poly-beta-1,6-N-acetylglucosamine synthase-like glycosyltransferase
MLINIFFWLVVFIIIHSYFIYPGVIFVLSHFFKENKNLPDPIYSVSIIISAYNEDKVIRERIFNISKLDYDFGKIEVLIGSDCSTDRTNEILLEMQKSFPWLIVKMFDSRRGKASVINDLVESAHNEIIVFTDANTIFDQNSLKRLIKQFGDQKVGGVCGRLILIEPKAKMTESIEEKKYWEYETFIKKYEGKCGVLIGANGGIFAIRRNLFRQLPTEKPITDDIFITLMIHRQNYKFSYEYDSFALENVGYEISHEFNRKTRFSATNFETLFYYKDITLNRNVLLCYAFWSHKILRWMTPIFLIILCILNILLFSGLIFQIFLYIQFLFYFLSFIGFVRRKSKNKTKIFTIPFYFSMTNFAMLIGMINFVLKRQTAYWQSTPR